MIAGFIVLVFVGKTHTHTNKTNNQKIYNKQVTKRVKKKKRKSSTNIITENHEREA